MLCCGDVVVSFNMNGDPDGNKPLAERVFYLLAAPLSLGLLVCCCSCPVCLSVYLLRRCGFCCFFDLLEGAAACFEFFLWWCAWVALVVFPVTQSLLC